MIQQIKFAQILKANLFSGSGLVSDGGLKLTANVSQLYLVAILKDKVQLTNKVDMKNKVENKQDSEQLNILAVSGSVFTIDDMKRAFNAGARNGSRAGMRVARGGELNMEHFDEWFPKHYR